MFKYVYTGVFIFTYIQLNHKEKPYETYMHFLGDPIEGWQKRSMACFALPTHATLIQKTQTSGHLRPCGT